MEELVKEIYKKTIEDLKKAGKLPFPLYYKEVFSKIAYDEDVIDSLNPKLLCMQPSIGETLLNATNATLNDITETSKNIKNDSQLIIEEIEEASPEEIKENVIKFSASLIEKINNMEKKIEMLEGELDKAYKDLLIDPLTKAYNRKALEKDLNELIVVGHEKDLDLVIAIIDIDDFKHINDRYGHLVGDFVLIKLVQIMKSLLRKTDKVYRYGGDEFIIVFNRSTLLNAQKSVERIIKKISKTALRYKENLIKITISAGLAKHSKGDSIEDLIKKADNTMYQVKKDSKNGYNTFKN